MALSHFRIEEVRCILSVMLKNLECPICLELMKEPVSTKCDHQFCRYCMLKLLGKKRRGIGQCPLCKLEITKRSLRESSRFKLLVEGLQKTICAFELDTGIKLSEACHLSKTCVKPTFCEKLKNDTDVVQSKGYTCREKNVTLKAGPEQCTVEFHLRTRTDPVVAGHSEQIKEQLLEPAHSVYIEFGSEDSSDEQLFKRKPGRCENEDGLIQVLPQEEEPKENNLTGDGKHSRIYEEHTEHSDETVPFDNDDYFEEDAEQVGNEDCSFGLNAGVKPVCSIYDGGDSCSSNLHPELNTSNKTVFNAKSADAEISHFVTEAKQGVDEIFLSKSNKKTIWDNRVEYQLEDQKKCGVKGKTINDLASEESQNESTNLELQVSHKPCDNESADVSKMRIRQSIEKVSEWLCRSDKGLQISGAEVTAQQESITLGQIVNDEEVVSLAIPCLPDMIVNNEFEDTAALCEPNRSSVKQNTCTVQEKIFGKTYKREKKQPVQLNLSFISENRKDVSIVKTTENTKMDRADAKKKSKRSSGLQPEDFIKRDHTTGISDQPVVSDAESVNPLVIKNTEGGYDGGTDEDLNCKTGDIPNENLLSSITVKGSALNAADNSAQSMMRDVGQESDRHCEEEAKSKDEHKQNKLLKKRSTEMPLHVTAEEDFGDTHQAEVSGSAIESPSVPLELQMDRYPASEEQATEAFSPRKTRQSRKCFLLVGSEIKDSERVTEPNVPQNISCVHSEESFSGMENDLEERMDCEHRSLRSSDKNEQLSVCTETDNLPTMQHSDLKFPGTNVSLAHSMSTDNSAKKKITLKHQDCDNDCSVLQEHFFVVQHSSQSNQETVAETSCAESLQVQEESLTNTMCIEKSDDVTQRNCNKMIVSMVGDVPAENEDSEVDTACLLQSFRISKRKSFILHHSPVQSLVQESVLQNSCKLENSKTEIYEGEAVECFSSKCEENHSKDLTDENSKNCQLQKVEESTADADGSSVSLQAHSEDTSVSCEKIPLVEKSTADNFCALPLVVQQISPVSKGKKTKCIEDVEQHKRKRFKNNSSVILVNYSLSQDSSTSDSVSEGVSELHQILKADCRTVDMPESLRKSCGNQEGGLSLNSQPASMPLFSVTSLMNQASICQGSAESELHKSRCEVTLKQNGIHEDGTLFGNKEVMSEAESSALNAAINGAREENLLEVTDCKRLISESCIPLSPDSLTSTIKLSGTNFSQGSSTPSVCRPMKDVQLDEKKQCDNVDKKNSISEMMSEDKSMFYSKIGEYLPECDVSSSASQSMIRCRKRSAQKLESSESDSSDEELPCFQAVLSSKSVIRSPRRSAEALKELSANSDLDREMTSSQCSEHSADLFSPGYEEVVYKPHMQGTLSVCGVKQEQTVISSVKIIAQESQNQEANRICENKTEKEFPERTEVHANHSEEAKDTDKGETSGCESEASHTGESSGFSSQSDLLTTQQREAIQKNIEQLEQEMAVLEAVLEEHGTQAESSMPPAQNGSSELCGPEKERPDLQMDCQSMKSYRPNHQEHHKFDATLDDGQQTTQECLDNSKLETTMECLSSPSPPSTPSYSQLKKDRTPEKVRAALNILEELKANIKSQEDKAACPSTMPDEETLEQSCPLNHKTGKIVKVVLNESCSTRGAQIQKAICHGSPWGLQANRGLDSEAAPRQNSEGLQQKRSPFLLLPLSSSKTGNKSPVVTSRKKMSLVASGLGKNELLLVQKFARKLQCSFSNQITNETTHVIMKTDKELVCERTLKYFLGIAGRKWIIGFQWVVESFKQGRILDEFDFEVRGDVVNGRNHGGPRRARESADGELLLKNYEICCYGCFTDMSSHHLEWLVELCGAIAVKEPYLFSYSPSHTSLVLVQPDAASGGTDYRALQRKYGASVVTREWVLDSVACYQCQNLHDYVVFPK